ncbi:spore coat protein [Salinithrix halophila]|uniref:Spore coat protein n=1 Tax=Salinithrix halophila TaxID=1485204 RepID=A0ABV8JJZ2_9BACL
MKQKMGAHEIMEAHEVLTDTIDGINQFQLYRPHVKDPQLGQILDRQLQYMIQEYDQMVTMINQQGGPITVRQPRQLQPGSWQPTETAAQTQPTYGLDNPQTQSPNTSMEQMDDRDVASGMLGCAKASAVMRMHASLECVDPTLRQVMVQGAVSCSQQAYETFQYMNQKGYYQVPTMEERTMNTVLNTYQPAGATSQNTSLLM